MSDVPAIVSAQPTMNIQPLVTFVCTVITASIAIYVFMYQRYNEKRKVCFELFKIWSSSDMYGHRRSGYSWIEKKLKSRGDGLTHGFSRNDMDENAPEVSNSIGIINHFIADINTLCNDKMIDAKLAKRLFWNTAMKDWFDHFEAAYCSENFNNKEEYKQWYKTYVQPLKAIMERQK